MNQIKFYEKLFVADFFDGSSKAKDMSFAARDRINRAPKALGFVKLHPHIQLTQAGLELLSTVDPSEVITRQLMKFQLPSPFHKDPSNGFNVKPYLELLRLIEELEGLSKIEIAIFFLQMISFERYNSIKTQIVNFRENKSKHKGNKKKFISIVFAEEIAKIYKKQINDENFKTRESIDKSYKKFVSTKNANMIDYADALIRYLRATELVRFEKSNNRVVISNVKREEVKYILINTPRVPEEFIDLKKFEDYYFNPNTLAILEDDNIEIVKKLQSVNPSLDLSGLSKDKLRDYWKQITEQNKQKKLAQLKKDLPTFSQYDDIISVYNSIESKDILDPPLYFEWNTWRAMMMLNYAKNVIGNFKLDEDGEPIEFARGNLPDIEIEYDNYYLIIEVTLSSGSKQFDMEGEPVARHFGKIKKGINKDLYCLFIAPKINDSALAHFFNLNKNFTRHYGGKTKIIPMELNLFKTFLAQQKEKRKDFSKILYVVLSEMINYLNLASDEVYWYEYLKRLIKNS